MTEKAGSEKTSDPKDYQQTLDEIARLGGQSPQDPASQRAVGSAFLINEEAGRALPFAQRAVELAPEDPDARLVRAHALERLGRFPEARKDAEEALRRRPADPEAVALVRLLERKVTSGSGPRETQPGADPIAEPYGGERAAPPPQPPSGGKTTAAQKKSADLVRQAAARMDVRDYQTARTLTEGALNADPGNASAYLQRGALRLISGENAAAAADATAAIERGLVQAAAYNTRSLARNRLGDYRGAESDARRALELDARSARARFGLAVAKEMLHEEDSALAEYRAAAELNSAYKAPYEQALARLRGKKSGPGAGRRSKTLGVLTVLAVVGALAAASRNRSPRNTL